MEHTTALLTLNLVPVPGFDEDTLVVVLEASGMSVAALGWQETSLGRCLVDMVLDHQ